MNDILKKKLASYSAVTASLLAANQLSSQAQIIYTNIPDTVGLQYFSGEWISSHYDLDLNNDGVVDFKLDGYLLTYWSWGYQDAEVKVTPMLNNSAQLHGGYYVAQLDCGEIIGPLENFVYSGRRLTGVYANGSGATQNFGIWDDDAPHLLGLRLVVDSDTLYGWVRLQVANYGEFEIFDYAYNSTPNQEIAACDTSSFATSASIINDEQSSITAFVSADNLTVIVSNNLLPNALRVMNILGEPIISQEIIEAKSKINLSPFPPGIYLVTVGEGKSSWSRKIVLSR